MKILVVEDDCLTANALAAVLGNQTYAVEIAVDGASAWELIEAFPYDLVLLDITLPKLDGISLCRQIRSHGYSMPILLLTAHDSGHEKAVGLDAGADDYVVKPFDPEELVARIRALLRRGQSSMPAVLAWEELRLDPHSCEVSYREQPLALTPKEYALLELFLRNPRRVFSCSAILENLWSFEDIPGEEAVRTHIKGLRQKLKAVGAPTDCIETVYGIGYRLKPAPDRSQPRRRAGRAKAAASQQLPVQPPELVSGATGTAPSTAEQTLAAIAGVWERFKPRILEQVAVLDQAAAAIASSTLSESLQQQAQQQAHSLAGSLGTFGLDAGSQIARSINQLLHSPDLNAAEVEHLQRLVAMLRQTVMQSPNAESAAAPLPSERPLLLLIDRDSSRSDALISEAKHWGLQAERVATLELACRYRSPQAVLLNALDADPGVLAELQALRQQWPTVPLLVLSAQAVVCQSREAMAPCIELSPSSSPTQVLKEVVRCLHPANPIAAKTDATIMVVDDDPHLLAAVRALLQPWGLHAVTLDDPTRFWQTLEATTPDLLVLDLKMAPVSGIDLCQQVRQDADWNDLPILILTSCRDARTVSQVFAAGADDFVSKPMVGPEFVTRIVQRLERVRLLSNLSEIDRLTQVTTRPKATAALSKLLRLAQRQGQCLSLIVIRIEPDCDTPLPRRATAPILRQVGQALRHAVREEDVVARWDEADFVLGLYGMDKRHGLPRFQPILTALQHQLSTSGCEPIRLRIGVVQFPDQGENVLTLYQNAVQQAVQEVGTDPPHEQSELPWTECGSEASMCTAAGASSAASRSTCL